MGESLFFVASQIIWFLVAPSRLLPAAMAVGVFLAWRGRRRLGLAIAAVALALWSAAAMGPLGLMALATVSERFPRPPIETVTAVGGGDFDAIIVLAGDADLSDMTIDGVRAAAAASRRLQAAARLAQRFPRAPVIFSGGEGRLVASAAGRREPHAGRLVLLALGVPADRLTFEGESRNTAEHAARTRALINPGPGERFALVTAPLHMPRSIGVFRKAGFDVTAVPVDYWPDGHEPPRTRPLADHRLGLIYLDVAVREWIGLVAYRLTGRSSAFFPGP